MRRRLLYLFLSGVALASACSRKPTEVQEPSRTPAGKSVSEMIADPGGATTPAAPPTVAPVSAEASTAAVPPPSQPDGAITPNDRQIIEDLQAALQAYYLKNVNSPNRFTAPRSLDELVRSGILKRLPNPPPGKKIVYHPENWQVTVE